MFTQRLMKQFALNIGIVIFNVVLFSPGLVNLQMGWEHALGTAIGSVAIFISLAVLFYGNYLLAFQKDRKIPVSEIRTIEDCILSLQQAYGKRTFDNDNTTVKEQVERFAKKRDKIKEMLLQKFSVIDVGFEKFSGTISDVEYVLYENVKSILNKINAFDEEDYERINTDAASKRFSEKSIRSKLNIYNEYISFVKSAIEGNEEILLKLDALLLEISGFDSLDASELENLKEIKELNNLIIKSRQYR